MFFSGIAHDAVTGDVSVSPVWTSGKDGDIGTGPSFLLGSLTKGRHTITATAGDPDENRGRDDQSARAMLSRCVVADRFV